MIEFLLFAPIIASPLLMFFQNRRANCTVMGAYAAGLFVIGCAIYFGYDIPAVALLPFDQFFKRDALSDLFFCTMVLVCVAAIVYSYSFLKRQKSNRWHTIYVVAMLLFIGSMSGALLSTHYGLFWVFIEATTLSSAVFIYFERTRAALAAVWKYIFICSIGIAFAFVGILSVLIGSNGNDSLYFSEMIASASQYSPFWIKIGFVFLIAGFGTKVGLAPVHGWKPDAYAEAPSASVAVLAGALSPCAFMGILRIMPVMQGAGLESEARGLLLFMGILSAAAAALFMLRTGNYKRFFAYSSIEHMGILAVGIASGGLFGSLLHAISHSLIKSSLFLSAGNLERMYSSRNFSSIAIARGKSMFSSVLFISAIAAICGLPPFSAFISEILIFTSVFKQGMYIFGAIMLFFLAVIFYAVVSNVMKMLQFSGEEKVSMGNERSTLYEIAPPLVLLLCALVLGLFIPEKLKQMIDAASGLISR